MGDVLSQNEIDALLSALDSGEINPDEMQEEQAEVVKLYDFRSPQKFSKDHIRTLQLIHDNFARIISNYLTAQVRKSVKVRIESVDQTTYEEFIHSVQNPTVLTIFKMAPLIGNILFETNPELVYRIVDILLGGSGEGKYKDREFTDIDKNIMLKINEGLLSHLKMAWSDVLDVNPEVEGIETNPGLNQTLAPNEPVCLIVFSIEIGTHRSFINMCIPFISIEKFLDKLVVRYWYHNDEAESHKEETHESLVNNMNNVTIPLEAFLGKTTITVNDFLMLMPGDVIPLEKKCEDPLEVNVEDKLHFLAKPGIIGKKTGIQIVDIIQIKNKDVGKNE